MTPQTFVLLSGTLTFGAPLVLAIRELLVLKPAGGANWRDPDDEPAPVPPTPDATVRKPLPDCLIPKTRVRAPELVE